MTFFELGLLFLIISSLFLAYRPTAAAADNETVAERRARLARQNDEGAQFFNIDRNGYPLPAGAMEDVLDLNMTMEQEDYEYTMQNKEYYAWKPFLRAEFTQPSDGTVILKLESPGRIRPKGKQQELFIEKPFCDESKPS